MFDFCFKYKKFIESVSQAAQYQHDLDKNNE